MHKQIYLLLLTHKYNTSTQPLTILDFSVPVGADQLVEPFLTIKTIQTERPRFDANVTFLMSITGNAVYEIIAALRLSPPGGSNSSVSLCRHAHVPCFGRHCDLNSAYTDQRD